MRLINVAKVLVVLSAAMLAGAAAAGGRGAAAEQTPDVLGALLTEVRGLRAAMEHMAAAGPRVQLALGRLELQEQRVNNLIRRLETLRAALAAAEGARDRHQQTMQMFATEQRSALASEEREAADHVVGQMKAELRRAVTEVQRLTAEQTSAEQELAAEQGRWMEFNSKLEELERSLVRR